jgi:zinc/manganese transport system substrate-binding protein
MMKLEIFRRAGAAMEMAMSRMIPMRGLVAAMLVPLSFACPAAAATKVNVVTSFSILADLVRQVGGERVEVRAFVGPNTDLHVFQPAPGDAKMLFGADLVIVNGLGLEGWADRLVKASGYKGPLVIASKGIKTIAARNDEHGHGHSHGHAKKGKARTEQRSDPHAWQDVANVKVYVTNIRDALIAVDGVHRADYERTTAVYLQKLDALEADVKAAYANIPQDQRRVITSHDAFGYYSAAYGIEFLAPQGVGGDQEPTAKGVASLIRQIKKEKVKAVFVENISNPRMIERIAKETGVAVGGTLYSDALSEPSGPAGSYIEMIRQNTGLLSSAMR